MNDSAESPKLCTRCGDGLPDTHEGLCPRCLMAEAMLPTQAGDHAAQMPILTPKELAPHFPQLEIIDCLGRGGMGVVYKARQKSLNRLVALKLLAPERADDPHFAERFEKEAHALAAMNHPHIVGVYDFGQAGGFFYLLMEFVDGVNLRQAMTAGRFTPEQALAVVPPVCEALQYAHEHGIVHRDIKPENLLLDKNGRVKIADFGIAKLIGSVASVYDRRTSLEDDHRRSQTAATGHDATLASVAGTPQYMSPEQKAHGVTDHRADIYSLGVVLYEMLTGELPADKLQPPSRKVQIDVRLDEIVLRALEKTPELRYQTAGEFRTQVETVVLHPRAGGQLEEYLTANGRPSKESDTSDAMDPASRFSRTAIAGAAWLTLFFAVVPAFLWHEAKTHEFENHGPFASALMGFVFFVFIFPAFIAPFGTTILGWISISQIRLSAGKLYGLGLAVLDGLLFPLLALDVAIWLAVGNLFRANPPQYGTALGAFLVNHQEAIPLSMLLILPVVDYLIIRRVWCTVNQQLGVTQPDHNPPPPSSVKSNADSAIGKWAFGLLLAGVLGSLLLLVLFPRSEEPVALFGLATLLLSLVFGLISWRDRYGRIAVIVNGVIGILAGAAYVMNYETRVAQEREMMKRELERERMMEMEAMKRSGTANIAPTGTETSVQKRSFGPVIERGIPSGKACLNLAKGDLIPLTEPALSGDDVRKLRGDVYQPMIENDVNALTILDVDTLELDAANWDNLSASALEEKFSQASSGKRISQRRSETRIPPGVYGFNTYDKTGILQVLGMSGDGVQVRYRLVQSASVVAVKPLKPGSPETPPAFGPVIERELTIAAKDSLPLAWLDLDRGKEIPTAGFTGDYDEPPGAFYTWFKHQGADLTAAPFETADTAHGNGPSPPDVGTPFYENGLFSPGGLGLRAMAVKPDLWDAADAKEILTMDPALAAQADSDQARKLVPNGQTPDNPKGKLPATFLFKTAEGNLGLIQILDFTEAMRKMKIRYKLVQVGSEPSTNIIGIDTAQRPLVTYLASQEQVGHIEALLKHTPFTADYPAAIFVPSPSRDSYHLLDGVSVFPIRSPENAAPGSPQLGEIYQKGGGVFFIKWKNADAGVGFYGPFTDTPEEALGLTSDATRRPPPS